MSNRVGFGWRTGGPDDGGRDAAWLDDFYDDLRTATGILGDRNLREEGLRYRNFVATEGPVAHLGVVAPAVALQIVPLQAWAALPGALATTLAGPFVIAPGESMRVRAALYFPFALPAYGLPAGVLAEMRIWWTKAGVGEAELFSEVWQQPTGVLNAATGLATVARYYNDTGASVTFTNLRIDYQSSAQTIVGYPRLEADRARRV